MRFPTVVVAGLCFCVSAALADPTAADLQAQGEDLAKQGRFSDAIDSFKAADKLQPSATHACLIALAYTRRELWPQAEIWLALCQVRATPAGGADPLPEWAPAEQDQINQRLEAANVAAVTIEVQPADAGAKLTVSSFAPDEQFSPRTIHLPPGIHQIIASAPGYQDAHQLLDIKDKTPQHVVIKLQKPDAGIVMPPPHRAPPPQFTEPEGPRHLMIAGAITIGVGFATWAWMGYEGSQLQTAHDNHNPGLYSDHSTRYDVARVSTIGLWAVGAGLAVTGYLLHRSNKHAWESQQGASIAPLPQGGAAVTFGWMR